VLDAWSSRSQRVDLVVSQGAVTRFLSVDTYRLDV
jgi:hypothetical protein